jgi:WYL domain
MTVTASWRPGATGPDPSVLLAAAQACRAGAQTERRVEPHRLVSLGKRWYLVAYDLDRQAWRNLGESRHCGVGRRGPCGGTRT